MALLHCLGPDPPTEINVYGVDEAPDKLRVTWNDPCPNGCGLSRNVIEYVVNYNSTAENSMSVNIRGNPMNPETMLQNLIDNTLYTITISTQWSESNDGVFSDLSQMVNGVTGWYFCKTNLF